MKATVNSLIELIDQALQKVVVITTATQTMVEVTLATQDNFGHYQSNIALKLASHLKKNPREVAQLIVSEIETLNTARPQILSKIAIAGPGFINFTLNADYLAEKMDFMLRSPDLAVPKLEVGRKIVIDFSSPNTAKEMHVGHLRSTIIGDSLARLFEFLGATVLRLNHVGDWGTAFGMLIAYMKEAAPEVLTGKVSTDLSHLVHWYRESKRQFDEDPAFKKRAQLAVVALQGGEADSLKAWQIICDISRKAYQEIYDLLNVHIEERGESFYNPMLADVVKDLESKGLVTLSEGARCVFLPGFKNREGEALPLMIQKTDGGFNYATTDIAALRHRIEVEKADRIIYVTDAGQAMHFAMIFELGRVAGYVDPEKITLNHVPFGLVLGADGKKFKTRSGKTERLMDLLLAAVETAKKLLLDRTPEMNSAELEKVAHILGINAVKYADLSCQRLNDYVFSYERMLQFEGNTAAYLMYAYARIHSIKRKLNINMTGLMQTHKIVLKDSSEIFLAHHLNQFADCLLQFSKDLFPNRLTDYLYQLAGRFNAFHRDCRVIDDPQQNARLLLCELTASVMRQGMEILGIQLLEKM